MMGSDRSCTYRIVMVARGFCLPVSGIETTSDHYDPVCTRPIGTNQATARMSEGES